MRARCLGTDSARCLDPCGSLWICDPLALSRAGSLANRLPSPLAGVLAHERPAARPCLPGEDVAQERSALPEVALPLLARRPEEPGGIRERRCDERGAPA